MPSRDQLAAQVSRELRAAVAAQHRRSHMANIAAQHPQPVVDRSATKQARSKRGERGAGSVGQVRPVGKKTQARE
jgi:hypothetical protein